MPLALFDNAWSKIKILDRFGGNLEYRSQVPFFMRRVSEDRIFIANQSRGNEIWVYEFEGNLARKIRKEYRPVAPAEEIKKAILGPDYGRSGLSQDKYFSNPLPPLNQFSSDDEGRLFVMTYEPGPSPGEYIWDIFNPDGVFVGRKALDIIWAGLYLGLRLTFVKNGRLYCQREKESGFRELFVYKMIWK